ncbi:MAG: carboxypeptidase-like regulatory domain-containing protein, partial [Muribaculaceae bacterium]|nr:carboxypeptidase-like regulatory domain-containing protein [Muribaculaceae bacterium]
MKRLLAIYIILVCAIVSVSAKGPVKISGLVTDQENEPLEFVTVRIEGKQLGATTGLDGRYSLSVPEADTIRIVFSCIGFEESKRRLISAEGEVTVNVKMSPASYALDGIEVTDYQKQTSAMQKIDGGDYKLAPDVSGGSVE